MSENNFSTNEGIQVINEGSQMFSENIVAQMIMKQSQLEERLKTMREDIEKSFELYRDMRQLLDSYRGANDHKVQDILNRLDDAEEDIVSNRELIEQLMQTVEVLHTNIKTMNLSMETMTTTLDKIEKNQEKADGKQDIAIDIQDKVIVNLWRAFFAVLGVVTVGGAAIVTLVK